MERYPDWLNATLASDAAEGRGVLPPSVKALQMGTTVVAPAHVVTASQDDNQAVVQATAGPPPRGCVLVVGGQSTSRTATIGDLMAFELQNLGVVGLVTDGLVRDAQELRKLAFPVWSRGTTPTSSAKRGPGSVGGAVVIGGVVIQDNDVIIADDDGVVVWPAELVPHLLERAQAKLDADNVRLTRLRQARADTMRPA